MGASCLSTSSAVADLIFSPTASAISCPFIALNAATCWRRVIGPAVCVLLLLMVSSSLICTCYT